MSKDANCTACNKYLGTIEKGRLSTKIKFICPACENKRLAAVFAMETGKKGRSDFGDIFKDLFGGK